MKSTLESQHARRRSLLERTSDRRAVERLAVGMLPLLSFALTMRILGDLSEPVGDDQLRKWPILFDSGRWTLVAVLLIGPAVAVLATARRPQTGTWRLALLVCSVAGSLAGLFYRIVIARVGGANIGGFVALSVGFPFVVFLLGVDVWLFREADRDLAER